ncbi:hypothetical protein [Rhizobium sp. RAF56]|uniref:hypothetical protein n=1 Tax=Rhizobium sp. RAF56 TaxID=3233062 RepID=UPI003F98EC9B
MVSIIESEYNFSSLSVKELLEARDLYHYHLMSKDNVVGTAIGLYLIRRDEKRPQESGQDRTLAKKPSTTPRTLANSEVREYSWPCVLVFVRRWETLEDFRDKPTQIVPKTLYMPDGKAVPVCVVEVDEVAGGNEDMLTTKIRPHTKLGGGLPITVETQGQVHTATAGCLVTDGNTVYALTARHACGEPGTEIRSQMREGAVDIGWSTERQLTRLPFNTVYPGFTAHQSYVTLDVGLVRLDDVNDWTSNIYGLPPLQPIADFYEQNLTLKLIDWPVVAYGAASGLLSGTIKAMFYRYRSVGGYDYVGDFLIAPAGDGAHTRHGDSGAIWHLDLTKDEKDKPPADILGRNLRPLAIEWGGQVFDVGGKRSNFAVATSLSNVCKLLDVELVTDQDRGVSGYWGREGHYSIATLAISQLPAGPLKTLLEANADLLSFDLATLAKKGFSTKEAKAASARLADVPDDVWKQSIKAPGGRDTQVRDGPEHPNHYADIDTPYGGKTLRQLALKRPKTYLTVAAWQRYYKDLADKARAEGDKKEERRARDPLNQGLLPFRVWQIFEEMVKFVRAGDIKSFVTAAGILAHYIGDGSQPLHGSAFADGDPSHLVTDEKTGEKVRYGEGVHSAFESDMLDVMAGQGALIPALRTALPAGGHGLALVKEGSKAALACIRLMDDVAKILPPMTIIDAYENVGARGTKAQATRVALWHAVGTETAGVMALGIRYLAMIWESAWNAGGGAPQDQAQLRAFTTEEVKALYLRRDFLASYTLDEIGPILRQPTLQDKAAKAVTAEHDDGAKDTH